MARSAAYWMGIMLSEKATMSNLNIYEPNPDTVQTFLADVKSSSKVARWRFVFWCVAVCAAAFDVVLDLAVLIMEGLAAKSRYATLPWWVDTCKKFQYGDDLVLKNLEYVYDVVDPTKQIIALAASQEISDGVNLKVAKLIGDAITPLSNLEKAAFEVYVKKKKIPGTTINVTSDVGDDLRLYLSVIFNPLVLKSNGESIASPGTFPVEDAVNAYLKQLGTIEFNGKFDLMRVVDFVQNLAGNAVISCYVQSASARYGANPFVVFTQSYNPNAGYLVIDVSNPLSSTITYTADV